LNANPEQSGTLKWVKVLPFDEKVASMSATANLEQNAGVKTSLSSTDNLHPDGTGCLTLAELISIFRSGDALSKDSGYAGKVVGVLGDTGAGKSSVLGQLSEEKVMTSITVSPRIT